METILAQALGGLLSGTASGKFLEKADLGSISNAILGMIGGVAGGQGLSQILGNAALVDGAAQIDLPLLAGQLAGGGLCGAAVQLVAGLLVKRFLQRAS